MTSPSAARLVTPHSVLDFELLKWKIKALIFRLTSTSPFAGEAAPENIVRGWTDMLCLLSNNGIRQNVTGSSVGQLRWRPASLDKHSPQSDAPGSSWNPHDASGESGMHDSG